MINIPKSPLSSAKFDDLCEELKQYEDNNNPNYFHLHFVAGVLLRRNIAVESLEFEIKKLRESIK